ncbi:hypothetical protein [Thermococcus sp.]
MGFINVVPVFYYELNVPPERVREAFPSALEFRNPSPGSFSVIQPPERNGGLLVIDLRSENRHVFVLPIEEELVLINDAFPGVFVVPRRGLKKFFDALAENDIERLTGGGLRRKGRKWRFIIDAIASLIIVSAGDYFHLGLWAVVLLGAVVSTVEYLFGPKQVKTYINGFDEKTVRKMYRASKRKGKVIEVSL